MEQTTRLDAPADHAALPAGGEAVAGDAALREELAKWRERVPKLAAALRSRAEEADTLKQQLERLRRLQSTGEGGASAGIRARDELIEELERKLADQAARYKSAQGELHRRQLEVSELKADVESWKGKWQSVTRSLDQQAAEVSDRDQRGRDLESENETLKRRLAELTSTHEARQRSLDEAVEERDSLRRRNEQLFETTELANRQIGSLTDSLAELRASLKQHREREARGSTDSEAVQQELEAVQQELEAARQELTVMQTRLAEAEASLERQAQELTEELHLVSTAAFAGLHASAAADVRTAQAGRAREAAEQQLTQLEQARAAALASLAEQTREVERIRGVVDTAQRTTMEREDERRVLSEQIQALEERNQHLEQQLGERSSLVLTLEQDQAAIKQRQEALQQERDELEESLMRAERHAKENADHITQLDAKLERQQELLEDLEEELAEAKEEQARVQKARQADTAEAEAQAKALQDQLRKLEGLVRERTDALNKLEWQREIAGEPPGQGQQEAVSTGETADSKLLLVLNQQLVDARARNDELLERLRELESAATCAARRAGDDLTRIHGVGQKLAEQLNDLGIYHYQQIAELDERALADEGHTLHGHRGRILRDGWIEQAVKLISH